MINQEKIIFSFSVCIDLSNTTWVNKRLGVVKSIKTLKLGSGDGKKQVSDVLIRVGPSR